jgi:hypothetical protein
MNTMTTDPLNPYLLDITLLGDIFKYFQQSIFYILKNILIIKTTNYVICTASRMYWLKTGIKILYFYCCL